MSEVLIQESTLSAIGNAIRSKTGSSNLMSPAEMVTAIDGIETGGSSIDLCGGSNLTDSLTINNSTKVTGRAFALNNAIPVMQFNFSNLINPNDWRWSFVVPMATGASYAPSSDATKYPTVICPLVGCAQIKEVPDPEYRDILGYILDGLNCFQSRGSVSGTFNYSSIIKSGMDARIYYNPETCILTFSYSWGSSYASRIQYVLGTTGYLWCIKKST